MIRNTAPKGLPWLVAGSFAVHAAVVGIVFAAANLAPRLTMPPQNAITTKLVRLGTPRPKELLPRLDEAPPPPPPPPPPAAVPQAPAVAPPAPPTPAAPKPAAAPSPVTSSTQQSAQERIKAISRTSRALDRLKQQVDGAADGAADGDSDVAVQGDRYATLLTNCMKQHFIIEGPDKDKVAGLSALVVVRMGNDGTILNFRIEKSSGVAAFDQATIRAVQRCGKIEPPPPALRATLRREGIEVDFH